MADISYLSMTDFCSFQEAEVDLSDRGLVLVSGVNNDTDAASSNGSGKSTMFKAIAWCLFGQTVDGDRYDRIIRRGAKEASVTVELRSEVGSWFVTRTRSEGSPGLQIVGPSGVVEGKRPELNARIERMLGMDFHTFKNTVLYGQGDSTRFANPATPEPVRKAMLRKLLRIEVLLRAQEVAKARRKEYAAEARKHDADLSKVDALILEHDVSAIEERISEWKSSQAKKRSAAIEEAKEANSEAKALSLLKVDKAALEAKADELRHDIVVAQKARNEAADHAKKQRHFEAQAEAIRSDIRVLEVEKRTHERAIELLSGDECPTCKTPVENESVMSYLEGELESMDILKEKIREKAVEQVNLTAKAEDERASAEEAQAIAETEYGARDGLDAVEEELASEAARQTEIDTLKAQAKERLERVRALDAEVCPYDAELDAAHARLEELKAERKGILAASEGTANSIATADFWVKGFGDSGIPSLMMDAVMPYLTEQANTYLQFMADSDISVEFSTLSTLASGDTRDKISINWHVEGYDDTTPSGGQFKKIEIATDVAMMDLVASRAGHWPNLMAMDEVLDGLDPVGRRRVMNLLKHLRTLRGSIFVITHEDGLADEFEHEVRVTKTDRVSTIEDVV